MKPSVLFACAAALVARAPAQIPLQPFAIDHRAPGPGGLDLSFLLEAPAGKDGPIRIVNGHLARPDGRRFRIWGVNLTDFGAKSGSVRFPEKADARYWADALARMGIDCVRIHSIDEPAPRGILAADGDDTRRFDPVELDRMDYFLAALKARGIYFDLNLDVGRSFRPGDGVPDSALLGYAKAVTLFDPHVVELEREYARALLTHRNPYTGLEYAKDPAVAMIEIVNENSLIGAWIRGRLRGTKTAGGPVNWQDIPPYYAAELDRMYRQWLARAHPAEKPVPRLTPEQFASAPRVRFETEAAFYADLESEFYRGMRALLRKSVGTEALLVGTSDFSYGKSDYPDLKARSQLDIIDAHGPWEGDPMVDQPANSIPVRLSRSALLGKPFTVSEHNDRFPSAYTCEGIPLLAAYGSFQDWDGIFLYAFELKKPGFVGPVDTRADLTYDPVKMASAAAGALMFLRGDVAAARETIERSYSASQVIDSLLLGPGAGGVYFTPGVSPLVALEHGSRIRSMDDGPTQPYPVAAGSPLVSDTGQLRWFYSPGSGAVTAEDDQNFVNARRTAKASHSGVVTIDTPNTQGLVGFLGDHARPTSHLAAEVRNPFASILLVSLDSKPIPLSSRMLLAATARDANLGRRTVIEPVMGSLTLRGLNGAVGVRLVPLDGSGAPQGAGRPAVNVGGDWRCTLGGTATTWYQIRVDR